MFGAFVLDWNHPRWVDVPGAAAVEPAYGARRSIEALTPGDYAVLANGPVAMLTDGRDDFRASATSHLEPTLPVGQLVPVRFRGGVVVFAATTPGGTRSVWLVPIVRAGGAR